jgi:probable lipoprotein NlpC
MGIPFAEKGRDRKGFDCWGLVRDVYDKHCGISLPSYDKIYQSTVHDGKDISAKILEQRSKEWITVTEPLEFDVIIMRMRGLPMHVGLVTRPSFMLHCHEGVGVSHENYTSARWVNRVVGFARYAGE